MTLLSASDTNRRAIFFRVVLGDTEGIVCLARRPRDSQDFHEEFFKWPKQVDLINDFIDANVGTNDIWFCPQLLSRPQRRKDAVIICPNAWADLDTCNPSVLQVQPTLIVESSPNRWQGYWQFTEPVAPLDAEDVSRRIAYFHSEQGCDKSGWDLTQLLRVPYTHNQKYVNQGDPPLIKVVETNKVNYVLEDFAVYPQIAEYRAFVEADLPESIEDSNDVLMRNRSRLNPMAFVLYAQQPKQDWSKALWSLELLCFECGLTKEEVFSIVIDSACNKYERDNRGKETLWKEVCRAYEHHTIGNSELLGVSSVFDSAEPLLTDEQRELVLGNPTFIEDYIEWAKSLGDASWQYHQAGAFIVLSSLLASNVRIPTSFGTVLPNLWFMILADTTLTRKSTSMDIAMDLLSDIDDNAVLATDGSIEGLFGALANRPSRSSIFLRDEFSGLLEVMTKKDYMAGMGESLTKLYDGKYQKRILKRETIEVKDPVLILFAGGIKSRIFELLTMDQVISGFLPRFIFITAEADVTKLKPVGPPTIKSTGKRNELLQVMQGLWDQYNQVQTITVNNVTTVTQRRWEAKLTDDAWFLYNNYETTMVNYALNSPKRDIIMPAFDRLAKSGLKVACLLAAVRCLDKDEITITELDILHAFYYVEQWRDHLLVVLENIGKSAYEKLGDIVLQRIAQEPGVPRGTIMREFRLNSKTTDELLRTLDERYLVTRVKNGKSERLYPPDYKESTANGSGTRISVNFK